MLARFKLVAAFAVAALVSTAPQSRAASPSKGRLVPAVAPRTLPPPIVVLEGDGDAPSSRVVLYAFSKGSKPRTLGTVTHTSGSARRGVITSTAPMRAFVVVQERESRGASTYGSALFRLQDGREPTKLRNGLTDASRPLLTDQGSLLVQAGKDGTAPDNEKGKDFHERIDDLAIEAIDPVKGSARTVWAGRGMIAYLATALTNDEALVYHVHESGAALFALHAGSGNTRTVIADLEPNARDFSFDRASDTIVFARASRDRTGYEIVSVPAHAPPRGAATVDVRYRTLSDATMPVILPGGAVALSLPSGRGLGFLAGLDAEPKRDAPLGDGSDEVVGVWESFLALRHRSATSEATVVYDRRTRQVFRFGDSSREIDVLGFAGGARP